MVNLGGINAEVTDEYDKIACENLRVVDWESLTVTVSFSVKNYFMYSKNVANFGHYFSKPLRVEYPIYVMMEHCNEELFLVDQVELDREKLFIDSKLRAYRISGKPPILEIVWCPICHANKKQVQMIALDRVIYCHMCNHVLT